MREKQAVRTGKSAWINRYPLYGEQKVCMGRLGLFHSARSQNLEVYIECKKFKESPLVPRYLCVVNVTPTSRWLSRKNWEFALRHVNI